MMFGEGDDVLLSLDETWGASRARPSRKAMIVQEVMARITSGRLLPGAYFPEDEIAEEMKVSRTPVREVANFLIGAGVLQKGARGGSHVCSASLEQFVEVTEALNHLLYDSVVRERRTGRSRVLREDEASAFRSLRQNTGDVETFSATYMAAMNGFLNSRVAHASMRNYLSFLVWDRLRLVLTLPGLGRELGAEAMVLPMRALADEAMHLVGAQRPSAPPDGAEGGYCSDACRTNCLVSCARDRINLVCLVRHFDRSLERCPLWGSCRCVVCRQARDGIGGCA